MEKSADAFRTISEVSDLLQTPAHVLRFWESRFPQIKPLKRAGGRRYYRPSDLALLGGIKKLLHDDGMTIRGVQKILREKGVRHVAALSDTAGAAAADIATAPVDLRTAADRDADHAPWPAAMPPAAAAPGTRLQPGPDGTPESVEEAPMEIDAPTLPLGLPDNIRTIQPAAPAAAYPAAATTTAAAAPAPPPAAAEATAGNVAPPPGPAAPDRGQDSFRAPAMAMLRAMDALRARDNKAELRVVYNRLMNLRDRLAERNRQTPI